MDFDNIEYLQNGSARQREAYSTLTNNQILSKLKCFDPILVGTIPINISIENSDLDIICCFADKQEFIKTLTDNFRNKNRFKVRELLVTDAPAVVANFSADNFEIEIFGQRTPTKQQLAYRHMLVEQRLLNEYGPEFRQQIIHLKEQGHKTEPAFAVALGLKGDPYIELLKFETNVESRRTT